MDAIGLRPVAALANALFPWQTIGPCNHEPVLPTGVMEWFAKPNFKTCYPYFVLWTDLLLGRAWLPDMPSMPTLFIYGTRKRPCQKKPVLDDAAVLARSRGEEPASPRHRAGVASMAWRTTRRFSTNAP